MVTKLVATLLTATAWFQEYVILNGNKTILSPDEALKQFQEYVILNGNKTDMEVGLYELSFRSMLF